MERKKHFLSINPDKREIIGISSFLRIFSNKKQENNLQGTHQIFKR